MNKTIFIEDIFLELCDTFEQQGGSFNRYDRSAAISFYNTIFSQTQLTQNQANYILRLLEKYKNQAQTFGMDYTQELANPVWRQPFRVIDLSKKVFVELDEENLPWICLKFPYQLKQEFDNDINASEGRDFGNVWDKERRLRMLLLYDYNIMQINEFVKKHNFEIDESFSDALASVEEIWQEQNKIRPYSTIKDNKVVLVNASDTTIDWFNKHSTDNIDNNLLLAKSMGYVYDGKPQNKVQKIAGTKSTTFFTDNYKDFFNIAENIDGKVCILLDRSVDPLNWLKNLLMYIDSVKLSREKFKVCFRESNKDKPEFNNWVKENNLGGKVNEGKYFIFKQKPAKWLFNEQTEFKIIVSNNIYPPTNAITRTWMKSHPCVIYFDRVRPSTGSNKVVEL